MASWKDAPLASGNQPTEKAGQTGWKSAPLAQDKTAEQKKDLYSAWGANITPEMEKSSPYLSATAKTAQEGIATPALHFLNMWGFNLPRSVAQQAGYSYPEAETAPGQILSKGAGVAGMVRNPLTQALAGIGMAPKTAGLGEKIGRGALAGGLGGAAYTPTEDPVGLPQRFMQAAGGALVGGATAGIGAGVSEGIKQRKLGQALKKEIGGIAEETPGMEGIPVTKERLVAKIGKQIETTNTELATHKEKFTNELQNVGDDLTVKGKDLAKKFGSEISKSYGKGVDELDQIMLGQDDPITSTYDDIGNNVIKKALDRVSPNSGEAEKLAALARKNGYAVERVPTYEGQYEWTVIPTDEFMGQTADMKELIKIKNSFSKDGGDAFHAFRDSLGAYLGDETRFPFQISQKYGELQKNYAPLANAKWEAYKIFRPWEAGDINTQAGRKFFTQIAMDDLAADKQRLLSLLESGNDLYGGVGDISSGARKVGEAGRMKTESLTRFATDLKAKQDHVADLFAKQKAVQDKTKQILKFFGFSGGGLLGAGVVGSGIGMAKRSIRNAVNPNQ